MKEEYSVGNQSLFISYCWKDGNVYADELETQLKDKFEVERDKSQLIVNDDIYDFMTKIVNCDNVIIVLTAEYVKSLNCMLEMSFLVSQADWTMKTMILVVDDSLYSIEKKLEIVNYWTLRQKRCQNGMRDEEVGNAIWEEEKNYVDLICEKVEEFFGRLSRRKNPSQIAIVNEVIKKSQRSKKPEQKLVAKGEHMVLDYIARKGNVTIKELAEETQHSQAYIRRLVSNLVADDRIEKVGDRRNICYSSKTKL